MKIAIAAGLAALMSASLAITTVLADEPPPGASSCTGCHAVSAAVETPVPPIRGRTAGEIMTAMAAFRAGKQPATVMDRIAKGFTDDELKPIAAWLAQQK